MSNQWKSLCTARNLCFNRIFKRNYTISTGISNLEVWRKKWSNWTSRVGQESLLGIRLHPNNSDSWRLRDPDYYETTLKRYVMPSRQERKNEHGYCRSHFVTADFLQQRVTILPWALCRDLFCHHATVQCHKQVPAGRRWEQLSCRPEEREYHR